MTEDTSDYAFPRPGQFSQQTGMTLRDWFAGQALQAIVTKHKPFVSADNKVWNKASQRAAAGAYEYADAMLAERSKP